MRAVEIPPDVRRQIVEYRRKRMSVNDICYRLGFEKSSERNAVIKICDEPGLRPYQFALEVGSAVKAGRSGARRVRE